MFFESDLRYLTWNTSGGNQANGTQFKKPFFTVEEGKLGLGIRKYSTSGKTQVLINFYLKNSKQAEIRYKITVMQEDKVLLEKTMQKTLNVDEDDKDGFTESEVEDLPSNTTGQVQVLLQIIKWNNL